MRTFVAIEVNNKDVLNSIHKIQTELNIKAKPVELHNMHFTVQFLGEVSEEIVGKISDALNSIDYTKAGTKWAAKEAKIKELALLRDVTPEELNCYFNNKNNIQRIDIL